VKITYNDVINFRKKIYANLKSVLATVDEIIATGRDEEGIPIYVTKYRIKSVDSIYLKTKRDNVNDLNEIIDYAGMRILCLFEEDIYPVHLFVLDRLINNGFILSEFKMFNIAEERDIELFKANVEQLSPKVVITQKAKGSGYKSLHYQFYQSIGGGKIPVELQLRTLLQDAWGELEHYLSYKQGNIHPHIKTSFALLARDLETNDLLISHLRSIRDKERMVYLYYLEKAGPLGYFDYEDELVPQLFKSGELKELFDIYIEYMNGISPNAANRDKLPEAIKHFESLKAKISYSDVEKDLNIKYILNMERAFLAFWAGKWTEALEIYEEAQHDYSSHYILNFRMGELYFIMGDVVKALVAFDNIEEGESVPLDYFNLYRIKLKLAYIYWLLGSEYVDYTMRLISEAAGIYKSHSDLFSAESRSKLINNLCAYALDKYIITEEEADFTEAKRRFEDVIPLLDDNMASANMIDTAAWFYFHEYKRTGDRTQLEMAKKYCKQIGEKENQATFRLMSINIQRNHIQEIMCAK
jgi:ppGpp synthetase/RelA/SpoT-type nucleotidyltranferase